ncbi:MAG TPA: hypothetical protein VLV18_10275, partial [Terriglobales bacterium]|nr:hypothetical protein [Terriglobales bacterium]
NAWYYSFSPQVAWSITQHASIQSGMRVVLYPLITDLEIGSTPLSLIRASPELAAVLSGLLIGSLIGLTYLALPFVVIITYASRLRRSVRKMEKALVASLAIALLGAIVAEFSGLELLMIVSSVATILSTLTLAPLVTAQTLVDTITRRIHQ